MEEELIIAGFGGQGVLSLGKIIAYSAVLKGKEVTWYPSYGPEMRGGTANVTVIIDQNRVSSPVIHRFKTAILLNQQSLDKFEPMIEPGGVLLYDPNGVVNPPKRTDINVYSVEASETAALMGNPRLFNMLVMGAYMSISGVIDLDYAYEGLKKSLAARLHHTLDANRAAMVKGMELVKSINLVND